MGYPGSRKGGTYNGFPCLYNITQCKITARDKIILRQYKMCCISVQAYADKEAGRGAEWHELLQRERRC